MNKSAIFVMLSVAALGGGTAAAQQMSGPAPGTVDSKQVTRDNRETQAEYNRTVAANKQRPAKKKSAAVAAAPADVTIGSRVTDSKGVEIGTVAAVDADGAVVTTGAAKVEVPLIAFGKNDEGLLLGITKAEFDALVAGATAG